uniref:Uncharacterized protein n=1 Tax=Alexandrium catenella TaxID=2925 RepID=A0A7S1S534_ALECA|mmetsp:Transcript_85512/g.227169  ORF Transcript_85512/g.227169 Transcript_85512/m.227169 type:complete len:294 (+) Transcript_85512:59-940(+)
MFNCSAEPPRGGASSGSRTSSSSWCCPLGHELQPWDAPAGICDGCGKRFPDGEQVMDCRRCEWLLCEVCCPRAGARTSLWGAFSQLPFYAVHRIDAMFDKVDNALDAFEERHSNMFDAADKAFAVVGDRVEAVADYVFQDAQSDSDEERRGRASPEFSPQQLEEAEALVVEFCEEYSESWVAPSADDLDSFWSRCSVLYGCVLSPEPLARALAAQLAREPSEKDKEQAWQPQLRALYVLGDLRQRGAVGQEIVADVARRADHHVRRLTGVPQCREQASSLLRAIEVQRDSLCV